ncbi:copia protein [Tanacetum coccineum]|uniref:Copia protein n=1 Tax=Tanacetum coccineum TaxID=301880 RepID=A0ABQ5C8I9_9ASTR
MGGRRIRGQEMMARGFVLVVIKKVIQLISALKIYRYPDLYKRKKAKKQGKIAANVSTGLDDHFNGDTPFDLGNENKIWVNQGGDFNQKLVVAVCQEVLRMFKGKGVKSSASREHANKFENRGVKCVLIGYPVNQKGYKLYNWETKEVFLSRDVVFEENVFPFKQPITPSNDQNLPNYPIVETNPLEETVLPNTPLPSTTHTPNFDFHEPAVGNVVEPVLNDPYPSTSSSVLVSVTPLKWVASEGMSGSVTS